MSRTILFNVLRFIVLVFVQVLLLKNISLYHVVTPYFYILFILLLPFDVPNFLLYILAFIMGITIDAFYDTPGLHAASCVFLAYARIIFISVTVQKEGFDNEPEPTLGIMGFRWFFLYALILTFLHHFFLLNLESFHLSAILFTTTQVIFSTVFTVLLMLISGLMFFKKKVR